MQRKVLALMIPALLMAGAAHAAEIYNKDGNKLDLYGKVDGLHYFSDDTSKDGDQTYMRLGFKGETQINDMMTGYAQWEYNIQANNTEGSDNQSWTRLAFAGAVEGVFMRRRVLGPRLSSGGEGRSMTPEPWLRSSDAGTGTERG